MASSGMNADAVALRKNLDYKVKMFKYEHKRDMTTNSASQMISNTLYYKRFFPFYAFNLVCGLDANGDGAVYGYDCIGSFEKIQYGCVGTSMSLITSLLDNQVGFLTQPSNKKDLSIEEAIDVVKDAMTCAGERDIYTGDSMDVWIITKAGTQKTSYPLKYD
jgi:20S proteasome subunit beta 6